MPRWNDGPYAFNAQRFWSHVRVTEGCWLWEGTRLNGYGKFQIIRPGPVRSMGQAHRISYVMCGGCIPPRMTLDHLCRVRNCVNPDHLEVVTNRENILRGNGLSARRARVTHCLRGHEYTEANTYRDPHNKHKRSCRACWGPRREARAMANRTMEGVDRGQGSPQ